MNSSMKLSKKELVKDRLIEEINNLTQKQKEKLLKLLTDWSKDKRNQDRDVQYLKDVTYGNEEKKMSGFINDLSPGGVFIRPAGPFSVGQQITIKFHHRSVTGPIQIDGEIVRMEKSGIGVKFARDIKALG